MNGIDQRDRIFDRGLLEHSMAQIEDMPGPSCSLVQHLFRTTTDLLAVTQ